MDLDARAVLDAHADAVFGALQDLATYPRWLGIVGSAAPEGGSVWSVELVGRIGPLRKTKKVRMARTAWDPLARTVRFERRETDGRHHNEWTLTGAAEPAGTAKTAVHVHLHYGGGLRLPGADRLLAQEVRHAGSRLQAFLDGV